MEKIYFNKLIKNPLSLNGESLDFLKRITEKYPYCQTSHILLAKNVEAFDKLEYEKCLNKASVYAVDRKVFLRYISEKPKEEKPVAMKKETSINNTPNNNKVSEHGLKQNYKSLSKEELQKIVNKRLTEIDKTLKTKSASQQSRPAPKIFMVNDLLDKPVKKDNDKKPGINLIDKFLEEDPAKIVPKRDEEAVVDLAESSASENDDIISETIAQIYSKQGKTDKAIEVYKKLSLKFPEKSSYFALRIAEVQKETN